MRVLVAGGAGYIGSHVVLDLVRAGHQVVVVDNLSTGYRDFVHPSATFFEADITDGLQLDAIFAQENFDVVMHFAAKLVVSESLKMPLDYYWNNVEGVRSLLSSMLRAGVNNIVFSSTAAVYGNSDVAEPLTESSPLLPINPYGASKLAAEQLIQWTAAAHGFKYAILRYFNAAGADYSMKVGLRSNNYTHLVPLAVRAALAGAGDVQSDQKTCLKVFGDDWPTPDGSCVRDYVHVSDLSSAHLLAADYLLQQNKSLLLNLGTEKGSSVFEVIAAVDKLSPCPYQIVGRRAGDPALLIADAAKARESLGWQAQYNLADIVQSDYDFRTHTEQSSRPEWI